MDPSFASRPLRVALVAIALGSGLPPSAATGQSGTGWEAGRPAELKPTLEPDETATRHAPRAKGADRLEADPSADTADYTLRPPHVVYDGRAFGPETGLPTHLATIEAPPPDAICLDETKRLWACGLQARAALNRLIRGQTIACTAVAETATAVSATCTISGQDLAGLLVAQGFARLKDGASSPAQEQARQNRIGLWNGGWTLR